MQIINRNILTPGPFFPLLADRHSFSLLLLLVLVHIELEYFLLVGVLLDWGVGVVGCGVFVGGLAAWGDLARDAGFLKALAGERVGGHGEQVVVALL